MVKIIDINKVLECCRFRKNIIFTKSQRIAANAVIVVVEQKISGLWFTIDSKTTGTEDFNLFFDCFEILSAILLLLINKTPSSVHVFPQRPEGDVN